MMQINHWVPVNERRLPESMLMSGQFKGGGGVQSNNAVQTLILVVQLCLREVADDSGGSAVNDLNRKREKEITTKRILSTDTGVLVHCRGGDLAFTDTKDKEMQSRFEFDCVSNDYF
jgi:hypothetical protein